MKQRTIRLLSGSVLLVATLVFLATPILTGMGNFLIHETEELHPADAAVVLTTGVDYTARLIEAARLYGKGLAIKVVINGDRKSDILKRLEEQGYIPPCPWSTNAIGELKFLKVPEQDIIIIAAPDAYDTISEAAITGAVLKEHGLTRLIITTSKFHTRRAGFIWQKAFAGVFDIQIAAAAADPFHPDSWWRDGRQIRQVLSEYGAWFYYWAFSRQ